MKVVFLSIVFFFLAGCSEKKAAPLPSSFPVKVSTAEEREVSLFIESLGHVESITSIQIRSRIEGELTGVFFEPGKEVKQGDLLFTIDPKPYEANLKAAQGALDRVIADRILAEEKVKRYKILAQDEYYSQIDYETLQANFASLSAQMQQMQGEVDKAAVSLNYCWIYAPIDGMMGILKIDYGNLVSADGSASLTTLNQMAPIYVTFSIPEFQLPRIQRAYYTKEIQALAAYEDFKQEVFEGTLCMIDNQVNEETGMIKLRAVFENSQRELWPGQFVRARLILSKMAHAVVIPQTAVQLTPKGPIVFVVLENDTVEQRAVKLGQREDDLVIVLEGIKKGEMIVIEGQINLSSNVHIHRVLE
jgi:multidrug efflux system membrane fusion protein